MTPEQQAQEHVETNREENGENILIVDNPELDDALTCYYEGEER